MDRALISCERFSDLPALLTIAESYGVGLELQEFADPNILDGDWRGHVARYRKALSGFTGELTLHGAFFDLFSGSPDRQVAALARERYRQNLTIAVEVGAHLINFHANYLPLIDDPHYLPGWTERQTAFWQPLAQEAGALGVTLVLENMWEPDPSPLRQVLEAIRSPHLRSCLDVAHARVYSTVPLEVWIEALSPFLILAHLHNTNGLVDIHMSFNEGLLDMPELLNRLRALPRPPIFCLELPDAASIKASLQYLQLDKRNKRR
jgi:sugar phosphate isomerase/epimerase